TKPVPKAVAPATVSAPGNANGCAGTRCQVIETHGWTAPSGWVVGPGVGPVVGRPALAAADELAVDVAGGAALTEGMGWDRIRRPAAPTPATTIAAANAPAAARLQPAAARRAAGVATARAIDRTASSEGRAAARRSRWRRSSSSDSLIARTLGGARRRV